MAIADDHSIETVEPLLITAAEVAAVLNISTRTLWRLRSEQKLPAPIRMGGVVRWRREEITNWIAAGCPLPGARENASRRT